MTTAPIAVSIGEPAGIGPDIIIEAWHRRESLDIPPFFVVGNVECLTNRASLLGVDIQIRSISKISQPEPASPALPVFESGDLRAGPGKPIDNDAAHVIKAIHSAVDLTLEGRASALVTCPINKGLLYDAGFSHPGHTEFLSALCGEAKSKKYHPVMMLSGPDLKTVPTTIHVPLLDVPGILTQELIVSTCKIVASDLRVKFGIDRPRLSVSGLNPHAGEGGSIGLEDKNVIEPAIRELCDLGLDVIGPLPADSMFHTTARDQYDAAICMYHDQALIPAKTLSFDDCVNVTLGLPIIRTSPDHGTAFDIAGSGKANPASFIAALKLAAQMASFSNHAGSAR